MGDMVDAVDPANIAHVYDHGLALHVSVLADQAGQCFDGEIGDTGPGPVAAAVKARYDRGLWSVLYINESLENAYLSAVVTFGVPVYGADHWGRVGCFVWCADPSGNIRSGGWKPRVPPVAIQDRYLGTVDLSTTFGNFPFTVAGYIDGPASKWPDDAWARFAALAPAQPPQPPPVQTSPAGKERDKVIIIRQSSSGAAILVSGGVGVGIPDGADSLALQSQAGVPQVNVTDAFYAKCVARFGD